MILQFKSNKYKNMDKQELLEQMMNYQEKSFSMGYISIEMCLDGIDLFTELSKCAETQELKTLADSYINHLKGMLNV